jgi:hypothetical protein
MMVVAAVSDRRRRAASAERTSTVPDRPYNRKNPAMDQINEPAVVAELTALAWQYEHALVNNDVPTLEALFWDAPEVTRFGATENLYGAAEIQAFRRARPALNLARDVQRFHVTTFGDDTGVVLIEFIRTTDGVIRYGRQSQTWRRFAAGGWKVVSGHVSVLTTKPLRSPLAVA